MLGPTPEDRGWDLALSTDRRAAGSRGWGAGTGSLEWGCGGAEQGPGEDCEPVGIWADRSWGAGIGYPCERHPALGSRPESAEGSRTGPLGSGIRDLGTVLRLRPVARNDPPPHRPLFLTGQQASRPVWRRSVPSRALQLPGAKRSQALNPQRPDRPGPDPLPASSTSASASSGTPPRPPRASQPGRAPGSLRRASRDW